MNQNNTITLAGGFIIENDGQRTLTQNYSDVEEHFKSTPANATQALIAYQVAQNIQAKHAVIVVDANALFLTIKSHITTETLRRLMEETHDRYRDVTTEELLDVVNIGREDNRLHKDLPLDSVAMNNVSLTYGISLVMMRPVRELINVPLNNKASFSKLAQILTNKGREVTVSGLTKLVDYTGSKGFNKDSILNRNDIRYLGYRLDFQPHQKVGFRRLR
jgi:hypothetical protein